MISNAVNWFPGSNNWWPYVQHLTRLNFFTITWLSFHFSAEALALWLPQPINQGFLFMGLLPEASARLFESTCECGPGGRPSCACRRTKVNELSCSHSPHLLGLFHLTAVSQNYNEGKSDPLPTSLYPCQVSHTEHIEPPPPVDKFKSKIRIKWCQQRWLQSLRF